MKKLENCIEESCSNKKAKRSNYCWRCNKRRWYMKYPLKYVYGYLRQNARRRDIEFRLTLEEFIQFCQKTKYMELKGQTKDSLSIDRKDPRKGYEVGNIQVLTLSENSSKGGAIPEECMIRDFSPF